MADPSQTPQNGHVHAVRFYKDDADLCVVVADFLREGLVSMQPALVIASPHRLQLAAQLQEYDFDVALLEATGDLFLVDADTVLSEFMIWRDHDFSLLCGYSMGSFYKNAAVGDANVDEICRHHTHVVTETGESASVN